MPEDQQPQVRIFGINAVSVMGIIFGVAVICFSGGFMIRSYLSTLVCETSGMAKSCSTLTLVAYGGLSAIVFIGIVIIA
jgi:predicted MFS family arabinose efflux permease